MLLSVDHIPVRPYPEPPAMIKEWLDEGALGIPERGDPGTGTGARSLLTLTLTLYAWS